MTHPAGSRGVSLPELLVSLSIVGALALGLQRFHLVMSRSVMRLATASAAEEGGRIAIEIIQRDLRSAGFSPDGSLRTAVLHASVDAVRIARDLNGDGDSNDANERLAYAFDQDGRRLMRRMGDAPAQPMLDNLAEGGLEFRYLADGRRELHPGDDDLTQEERKRIRRIDIALALELPNPDPQASEPIRSRQTATVSLRNGSTNPR